MERMDARRIHEWYHNTVLPELFERLDHVFPEFQWQRKGEHKWESGPEPRQDIVDRWGSGTGRVFCKRESLHGFSSPGRGYCSWTQYVTGSGSEPSGHGWTRAALAVAEEAGIPTDEVTREASSEEERKRWERQRAERLAEAKKKSEEAARAAQAKQAADIKVARDLVRALITAREKQRRTQVAIGLYFTKRGRDQSKMPGGVWPTGCVFGETGRGANEHTLMVAPAQNGAGKVTGLQRYFMDDLGRPQPRVVQEGGEPVRKATFGIVRGAAVRIGKGWPDRVLVLCEGYETGLAIHQATHWTVWACLSTGGLKKVEIAPADLEQIDAIVIGGDLDEQKEKPEGFRPGQAAGRDAADRIRTLYAKPCALALPAHAWAPELVTADELPREGKSVDWEDVANRMGDQVVRERFRSSRAVATLEVQGRWPWEPEDRGEVGDGGEDAPFDVDQAEADAAAFSADGSPAPDSAEAPFVPDGGSDRREPQWDEKTAFWYRWAHRLERWVKWDSGRKRWIEPFAPVLSPHNLRMAHEYLVARHAPTRIGADGSGLELIETGSRCYLYDGTKWVEYGEASMAVIRGEVRRYFADHCKPKTNREGVVTHYVPANISKSEVESIASAVIDEVRTVLAFEAFRFQFWSRPNIDRDRRISREHATWKRVLDHPEQHGLPAPESVTPVRNGLIDLQAWTENMELRLIPHTPLFFSTGCIEAELPVNEAQAALDAGGVDAMEAYAWTLCPEWKMVLEHAFNDKSDPECAPATIRELGKVFGYHLTCSMDFHKGNITWHVGPPKCGKSTILKVNAALMGASNCVASSMEDMADSFHFDLWIGKRVAHLPDLAVSGRMDKIALTETLKKLGSAEPMSVNRKHIKGIPNWRSMAKIMVAANQVPPLPDPTQALPRRSMAFAYKNIVKVEDTGLERRIIQPRSLAGVQLWALCGLYRLHQEGFCQPMWSEGLIEDLKEQGSRYPAFIEACIEIDNDDPDAWLATEDLTKCFAAYAKAEGSSYAPDASRLVGEIRGLLMQRGWVEQKRNQMGGRNGYRGLGLSADGKALLDGEAQTAGAGGASYRSEGYGEIPFTGD